MDDQTAISLDGAGDEVFPRGDLAPVEIYTLNGDHYAFPAMSKSALQTVIPKGSNQKKDAPLTLVNASTSILMIPMRIVKKILVDGEEWWVCPA